MGGFRAISRAIASVRIVILARILTPTQFGVFGIATIVLSFLEILTETGINIFLIQEKDIDRFINSAWIISILRGFILTLLIIVFSPILISFFKMPDLHRFLILISAIPFVRGFINPSSIKFQKELKFNNEFYLRTAIYLFDSLVSIILALAIRDAIAFVWGLMAGAMLEVILSFALFKPRPTIKFEFTTIKTIIHNGKWVTAYGIFDYVSQNADNIVVGKILGPSLLGIYEMGYNISTLPISEISDVVNKVVFPVYSKISDDRMRLLKAFKKTILITSIPVILLSFAIYFLPKVVIDIVLGPKWESVSTILKILTLYGMLRAISGISSALFLAIKKQNFVAGMTFVRFVTLIVTIVPLTLYYGIIGASFSALLSVLLEIPLIGYYIFRTFKSIGTVKQ